jgi:hypothetical protein
MTRSLVLLTLLGLPVCIHGTLVAGPESPLTTAPADVAAFEQTQGRIATDGTGFFAVWKDGHTEVHGTAVGPNGQRLYDVPLRIATGAASDDAPGIEAGGGGYLVAWSTAPLEGDVAGMRARLVRVDGSMTPVLDLGTSDIRGRPHVAFNGANFLVMWLAPELRLRGAVVRFDGTLLRTFEIASAALSYPDIPLVAVGNLFYYAIGRIDLAVPGSSEGNAAAVHLVSVDENGNVGTPVVLSPALAPVFNLRAEERSGDLAVAWGTNVFNPGQISAVRVTGGTPGSVETFDAGLLRLHDVFADASGFQLIYGNESERRVRAIGSVEAFVRVPLPPMTVDDVVSNGTRTLMLARALPRPGSYDPLEDDLYLQQVDDSPLEPLSVAPRHQTSPGIGAAGDLRLAVWTEHFGAQRRLTLVAARIDANGQVLDPNGIDLGLQATNILTPYVASNGTEWLVAWWDFDGRIYGMRIARDGTRLDPTPFIIAESVWGMPGRGSIGLSWDGEQYVVTYIRGIFIRGLRSRVYVLRVRPDGTVQQPELPLVDEGAHDLPAVASDPVTGQSLVVWNSGPRNAAALVSRGGTVVPVTLASEFPTRYRPAVAWSAGSFLTGAVYSGPFGNEVRWHLVSTTGVVRMPLSNWVPLRQNGGGVVTLDLEATADGFLLYTADASGSGFDLTTELTAARISAEGLLTEGPQTIAETEARTYEVPFAAAGTQVVYVRDIGHVVREITRLYTRSVSSTPGRPKRRAVR